MDQVLPVLWSIIDQKVEQRIKLKWDELYPDTDGDLEDLERPFCEEEVRKAVVNMAGGSKP